MRHDVRNEGKNLSLSQLQGLVFRSRLILCFEEAIERFWQPTALLFVFVAALLTGWLPHLSAWLHLALLLAFAAVLIWQLRAGARAYRWPSEAEARRRLEKINGLAGRPLETLDDQMAGGSPAQYGIWETHKQRLWKQLTGMATGGTAPRLTRRDPYALRMISALMLIVAFVSAGSRPLDRIADSLFPQFTTPIPQIQLAIDAWITPPAYTGEPPVFLASGSSATPALSADAENDEGDDEASASVSAVSVPAGSALVVQIAGVEDPPKLTLPDGTIVEPEPLDKGAYRMEAPINSSGDIQLDLSSRDHRNWSVVAIPDAPPEIIASEKPRPTPQLSLTILYKASDDFGLSTISAEFRRADAKPSFEDIDHFIETPLPVPPPEAYDTPRRSIRDLTAHPWAGGLVEMTLVATDVAGQVTKTRPMRVLLPERVFQHPVARAIIAQRRELAWDPERNWETVAKDLREIATDHQTYGSDLVVFMALDMSIRRLARDKTGLRPKKEQIDFVVDMLWKTALRLDDGGLSLALARLRAAEEALAEAMARDAGMAELERLMQELQNAMNDYLDAMREDMQRRMAEGEEPETAQGENTQMLRQNDLDSMLDQIRELMRNGMKEEAQEMLAQLQRMMENLRMGSNPQLSPEAREGMEMLNDMGELMNRQRDLLDQSFRRSQQEQWGTHGEWQGQRGDQQDGLSDGQVPMPDAEAQAGLRQQLGDVMRRFGEMMDDIPAPFGDAERAMRDAEQALRGGDATGAVDPQSRAMDQLQSAAQVARDMMMERFSKEMGNGEMMPSQGGKAGLDPFGREPSADYRGPSQGEVDIPDQGTMERAREVRDELRRRSGQRNRPPKELDYIDRLLDQFQ